MTLSEFVKNYREEHDLSIRTFASMVGMSIQQVSNIERGIGNNGKPMTSNYKTYQKIACGIGMEERDFMLLLNDNVRINPSEEKIPATTEDDGKEENEENLINSELLKRLMMLSPEELIKVDAFVQGLLASR